MKLLKYHRIFLTAFSLCISHFSLFSQENNKVQDLFQKIALTEEQKVVGLEKNKAPILPNTVLKWDEHVQSGFRPSKSISTQKELDRELLHMKKQYEPYLKSYVPKLDDVRDQVQLETFQWKLISTEMGEDSAGNVVPLESPVNVEDKKDWVKVSIPHYSGPINKAEAHYKRELTIGAKQYAQDKIFLHFNGVDYKAQIFLNGKFVGEHTGLFDAFEFDIKPFVHIGKNRLLVKVFNDAIMMGDSFFLGAHRKFGKKLAACGGPGWNEPGLGKGWTMCPPGFGIWQSCYVETRSNAYIHDVYTRALLDEHKVEVVVEVSQSRDFKQIQYSLFGQNFKATIAKDRIISQNECVHFSDTSRFRVYKFTVPIPNSQLKVWSLESPWLYQLQIKLLGEHKILDTQKQQFGMRSFTQSETSTPKGRFYLNGKEIKLRGANMMGNIMQCIIRKDYKQLEEDILLAKIAGMNFWRMTQQPCQKEAYDYFDKLGLLTQVDMPAFNGYRKDALEEVKPQFEELVRMIRSHPCNALISYLNEPDFSKPMMLDREGHVKLFSSFDKTAKRLNPDQVTKWVDGDYLNLSPKYSDHHIYDSWYGNGIRSEYFGNWPDSRAGWMHGCGEFGAEGLDNIKLMNKYFPREWLKPNAEGKWSPIAIPRCQTPTIGLKWLSLSDSTLADWVESSRTYQMWATRLFTESLRRDPKMNSFAIHSFIDAWPSSWLKVIVDTDRKAKPAFFAYRDALQPIAVNLRPNAFYGFSGETKKVAVFVCNDTPEKYSNSQLRYQVEFGKKILYTGHCTAKIPASSPQFQGWLEIPFFHVEEPQVITVRVALYRANNQKINESSYNLDILPLSYKNKDPKNLGGYPQRLIK